MHAGFKPQSFVCPLAAYLKCRLFVTAKGGWRLVYNDNRPPLFLYVSPIHIGEFSREKRRFFSSHAGANLKHKLVRKHVFLLCVLKNVVHLILECVFSRLKFRKFLFRKLAY